MKLKINEPYVKGNRLISKIEYDDNKTYDLWFEVEEEYIKYLCFENADAFLIALLPFIIKYQYSVEIKSVISSRIYYQLTSYLIPLLCKAFNKNSISIDCKIKDENFNPKYVGASMSCGVDSFYTFLKHINQKDSSYNITHLTYFNAGSHGKYGGEKARKLYKNRLKHIKKFCDENSYNLVTVDSNMNELIMMEHEATNTFRTLSCVLALQKLFSKYYFASCCDFNGSHIDKTDTTHYDILNVQCLSNNNVLFYCSGLESNRQDKIKFISEYQLTYKYLDVCVKSEHNCGECEKCIRTMTALEAVNKLQEYSAVFDLEKYKKQRFSNYVKLYKYNRYDMKHEFYSEIIKAYKENGKPLPISAYMISLIPNLEDIKNIAKKLLPKKITQKIQQFTRKNNDGWID